MGEITRLMKFPGVARTFIVKIVAGLPSGESSSIYTHVCAELCIYQYWSVLVWSTKTENLLFPPQRYFPGDVLHHCIRILQAETRGKWLSDVVLWDIPNGKSSVIDIDELCDTLCVLMMTKPAMFVQVIQGGVIGRLTSRYSESSLLLLAVGVSSLVGLAQVRTHTRAFYLVLDFISADLSLGFFFLSAGLHAERVPVLSHCRPHDVFSQCVQRHHRQHAHQERPVVRHRWAWAASPLISDVKARLCLLNLLRSFAGTMLGLCASVQSLLRTVGPTVGGFLYVTYGVSSIGTIQCVINIVVFAYLLQRHFSKTPQQMEWNVRERLFFSHLHPVQALKEEVGISVQALEQAFLQLYLFKVLVYSKGQVPEFLQRSLICAGSSGLNH